MLSKETINPAQHSKLSTQHFLSNHPTMQIFSGAMAQSQSESHLGGERDSSLLDGWFEEAQLPFLGTGQRNGVALGKAGVAVLAR